MECTDFYKCMERGITPTNKQTNALRNGAMSIFKKNYIQICLNQAKYLILRE